MGVILTFFTGGATAVVQATNAAEKGTAFLKIFAQEMVATATLGISAIMQLFRMLITKFIQACKNGWIGLKKFLDELLNGKVDDIARNEEVLNDEIEISKVRAAILAKWIDKFDKRFQYHFDGEFSIGKFSNRDATQILKGSGGHNHLVIGKNIRVRTYLTQPIDDLPFDALISIRYKNGQWIEKVAKSSMFPLNWDIIRVKEEIALIYDLMIKSGVFEKIKKQKTPSFKGFDSTGRFEIKIEFDEFGDITNGYPNI